MYKEIGIRLREARITAGFTLLGLAKHLGISYQQVQNYETGQTRQPIHRLVKAAEVLDVSVGQLIGIEVIHVHNVKRVGELENLCKQKDEEIKDLELGFYELENELNGKTFWQGIFG